jgi:hypothetical protein
MTTPAPKKDPIPKVTLCGYAWNDVQSALMRGIANADLPRAQRWAAELVCTPTGLGRLEATLIHTWALHVGSKSAPGWPTAWKKISDTLHTFWIRSGGDIRTIRNTPAIRAGVAEAVAWLVYTPKNPLPALPTSADCMREAEATRTRLRTGGSGEQIVTRRIWAPGPGGTGDAPDVRTIGNEFEASIRSNNIPRILFWIVWTVTLDTQADCPTARERGGPSLPAKAKKSLVWFLVAILRELSVGNESINIIWSLLEAHWTKLGAKGRRDLLASGSLAVAESLSRFGTLSLSNTSGALVGPSTPAVQTSVQTIDATYTSIAEEARRYVVDAPRLGLSSEIGRSTAVAPQLSSLEKLAMVHSIHPSL